MEPITIVFNKSLDVSNIVYAYLGEMGIKAEITLFYDSIMIVVDKEFTIHCYDSKVDITAYHLHRSLKRKHYSEDAKYHFAVLSSLKTILSTIEDEYKHQRKEITSECG